MSTRDQQGWKRLEGRGAELEAPTSEGQAKDAVPATLYGQPRSIASVPDAADRPRIVARYKQLRAASQKLGRKLLEGLSTEVLNEGGKKLGMLRRGTFVFDSEDETAVLMDYCIHDIRRKGRNAFEQYLAHSPPAPESDEMECLRAMQSAIYSLFRVESVLRGFGVMVRDLLSSQMILVVDLGLSSTAAPGLVFASRLLFHEEFAITGGAALPLGIVPEDNLEEMTDSLVRAVKPNGRGHFDPGRLICECLSRGCSSRVQYREPTGKLVRQWQPAESLPSAAPSRNGPCPCGSGKKFKHCCMKAGLPRPTS